MSINRNNYEAYLLDLSEGNLSDELRSELNSFLAQNPDLESDLIDEFSTLDNQTEFSMDRDSLNFESINNSNREHFFIAYHEGDLSPSEQSKVLEFISNNKALKQEFNAFSKSYLKASTDVFEGKKSLHSVAYSVSSGSINDSNRKDFFIAYHESDLSSSEQSEVLGYISENEVFEQEFNSFSKAYLKASTDVFEDKESLHDIATSSNSRGLFYWSSRIAAILIIGFILNALLQNTFSINPKYTFENNGSDLKPTIPQESSFDVTNFLVNKNSDKQNNAMSFAVNNKTDSQLLQNKVADSTQSDDNKSNDYFNYSAEKKETEIPKKNPELNQVIASLTKNNKENEKKELKMQPNKKIETPPSLLAYLGEKAKEKELLTENGRPNILSLINKGSKSLTGQEVIAQTKTEQSTSTIFQLGNFKIERINKK